MKIVGVLLVMSLLVSCIFLLIASQGEEVKVADDEKRYQGPVPEGYDLEHFRKTGETIKGCEK